MNKVFINEKTIFLGDSMNSIHCGTKVEFMKYESDKTIREALNFLKTSAEAACVLIYGDNQEELREKFRCFFKNIEAAGGLVKNAQNEVLFIFRLGKWDLPKGKIEQGETVELAAVREVEEECGITGLEIVKPLIPSYHIYELRGEIILKKTYWFEMFCEDPGMLTPQTEEGITEVKWLDKKGVSEALKNTYPSIRELFFRTE